MGSTVSAELWSKDGWTGVCAAGGAMFAIGLLRWAADVSRPRRARSGSGPDAAHREVQGLANISANATT